MKPVILNADYMISSDSIPEIKTPTEIHFTRFGSNEFPGGIPTFLNDKAYKIFCHVNEPTSSRWVEPLDNIIKHHKLYDKVVTSNPLILEKCSNASFMIYGTTWLNKSKHHQDSFGEFSENLGSISKEFSMSMVCGNLHGKIGYNIRHIIFSQQNRISIPKKFYSSTRFPIPGIEQLPNDDKIHLFNSMYSVAIESTQEINYITEKLIDCLITKTIPIYWGCPNISEFFDTSYWINIEDIFMHNYSEVWYNKNIEKIEKNYNKAKQYCKNIFERVLETK